MVPPKTLMPLTTTIPRRRRREPPRAAQRTAAGSLPRQGITSADARARRAGGPQDHALYHCHCGYQWTGPVTASVGCPHCGTPQAW